MFDSGSSSLVQALIGFIVLSTYVRHLTLSSSLHLVCQGIMQPGRGEGGGGFVWGLPSRALSPFSSEVDDLYNELSGLSNP